MVLHEISEAGRDAWLRFQQGSAGDCRGADTWTRRCHLWEEDGMGESPGRGLRGTTENMASVYLSLAIQGGRGQSKTLGHVEELGVPPEGRVVVVTQQRLKTCYLSFHRGGD